MLEKFFPVSSTIGFLERSAESVSSAYLDWQRPILARYGATIASQPVEGRLAQVFSHLLPLTSPIRERFLFLETSSEWSAFFDNFWKGTDAAAPIHYLSARLRCRGVRITSVSDSSREDAGNIFEVCHGSGERRTVFCSRDGARWKFGTTGKQLPFEDPTRYTEERVRDRFPPELAQAYLRALGIDVSDESFFEPKGRARGFLLARRGKRPPSFREHPGGWT